MTKEDDFLDDDFLRDLIRHTPLDSPSDGFTDGIMEKIQLSPGTTVARKPFFVFLKASVPFVILALVLLFVTATSDLPIFNWLPGMEDFTNNFLPDFGNMVILLKNAFASKFISWGLLISFSAGALFFLDRILTRRSVFGL